MIDVELHEGLVKSVALDFFRKSSGKYELDDLVGAGRLGLTNAAKSFDENRGVQFSTYARKCITTSILQQMKNFNGTIRSPYNGSTEDNRAPDCVSVHEFWEAVIVGEDIIASSDLRLVLSDVLDKLTERQQQAVQLVYFEQMTLEDAAEIMSVSTQRVHQMINAALTKMRKTFEEHNLEIADFLQTKGG